MSDGPSLLIRTEAGRSHTAKQAVGFAVICVVFGVVFATNREMPGALRLAAVVAAGAAVVYAAMRRDGDPMLRVTPDGLHPERGVFIPAARVGSAVVRQWTVEAGRATPLPWVGLSVVLDDGREVCVPAVARGLGRRGSVGSLAQFAATGHAAGEQIPQLSRDGGVSWEALRGPDGMPVRWTALTDDAVAISLQREFTEILRPGQAPQEQPRGIRKLVGVKFGSNRAFGLILLPGNRTYLYTPLKPIPTAVPLVPSRAEHPAWDVPMPPVCFQSRASGRGVISGPSYIAFGPVSLALVSRGKVSALLDYDDIDRLDDAFGEDGVRRLSVVMRGGDLYDVPGLRHGLWAADPTLQNNELRWWHGERPDGDHAGSIRWGSDDTDLALTRLREQLDAARDASRADAA